MDSFIGEIRIFAGVRAPQGWAFCEGQALPIQGNEALYSLIGTTYGGNGVTNFNLPDLRGRIPIGQGSATAATSARSMGQALGTETVTITLGTLPDHTHPVYASTNPANGMNYSAQATLSTTTDGTRHYLDVTGATVTTLPADTVSMAPGGGQAHNNMMPFLAVNYIMSISGLYPDFG